MSRYKTYFWKWFVGTMCVFDEIWLHALSVLDFVTLDRKEICMDYCFLYVKDYKLIMRRLEVFVQFHTFWRKYIEEIEVQRRSISLFKRYEEYFWYLWTSCTHCTFLHFKILNGDKHFLCDDYSYLLDIFLRKQPSYFSTNFLQTKCLCLVNVAFMSELRFT